MEYHRTWCVPTPHDAHHSLFIAHDCMVNRVPHCAQATNLRPLLVGDNSTGGRYCQFRLKTAPWATGWRATLDLRMGSNNASNNDEGMSAGRLRC